MSNGLWFDCRNVHPKSEVVTPFLLTEGRYPLLKLGQGTTVSIVLLTFGEKIGLSVQTPTGRLRWTLYHSLQGQKGGARTNLRGLSRDFRGFSYSTDLRVFILDVDSRLR